MRIKSLSAHVANQIAAGEVIERPASVVKELLENALDAGAKNIIIEIGFGGLNQIKISDDGAGIIAEDLPLAIASHATSKLKVLDDLYAIESMGFRGEALASIASVAHVLIQSRAANASHAMALESDLKGIRLTPCARNQGTTIEVRDLFFNAPVRKKFLKSAAQEYQAIETLIKRIAFSKSSVALTVYHNNKCCLQLPAAPSDKTQRMRLTKLLGKAFVDSAVLVDITRGHMRLHGFVSGPDYARSQQDKLWFYINQRMVRDKLILHALRQAYADILPEGRYPACVLFLNLPLDEVDINVHPSKFEVRFSDARGVHDLIRLAIIEMRATHAPVLDTATSVCAQKNGAALQAPAFQTDMHEAKPWVILNTSFAVLTHARVAYLIDVARLHQHARLSELKNVSRPWDARPLLVPVVLDVLPHEIIQLETHQALLKAYGLILDALQQNTVRISAIPRALPALDLRAFLSAFCVLSDRDDQALMRLLIDSEMLDLTTMMMDEQLHLIAYWKNLDEASRSMSLCLDINNCSKVLDCA
ncbi:MAG: DNA mismatch repair endonuclease MutL [Legionella sp.]|nr:DNA mismatch repair endonuclease MutL [Legionella sp.]